MNKKKNKLLEGTIAGWFPSSCASCVFYFVYSVISVIYFFIYLLLCHVIQIVNFLIKKKILLLIPVIWIVPVFYKFLAKMCKSNSKIYKPKTNKFLGIEPNKV